MFNYPEKLEQDKYAWVWKPKYYRLMKKKQQFSAMIAGRPGSGKSWLALGVAELFNPDFIPSEAVCFDAKSFANRVADYSLKKADVLILDDAGLSVMSGDAQTREVKSISKTLQSIRHRSLVVLLTVPSIQLLAKSTRILSDYYMEPLRWDMQNDRTICKFQHYSHSPLSGQPYRSNHIRVYKKLNPVTGFTETIKEKVLSISVPTASKRITKNYDKFKKERMKAFDTLNAENMNSKGKKKRSYETPAEIARLVVKKRDDFIANGKVSAEKIAIEFNCGVSKARTIAKMAQMM